MVAAWARTAVAAAEPLMPTCARFGGGLLPVRFFGLFKGEHRSRASSGTADVVKHWLAKRSTRWCGILGFWQQPRSLSARSLGPS
jgi:hypothetical protein